MSKETIRNRYGDEFTFTLLEDGNIQWSGNFEYVRIGYPNDYPSTYQEYVTNGKLMRSIKHVINMVDPSGGPYLTEGMEIMGKTIKEFKRNKEGYLIITK